MLIKTLRFIQIVLILFSATLFIICGAEYYTSMQVVHPDEATVMRSKILPGDETIYKIGDLEVGVAKAERMEMKKWINIINEAGKKNNKEKYIPIPDDGDEDLSIKKDNPKASARPLVVLLDVENVGVLPYKMESRQIFLSLKNGTLIKPSETWQKKIAEAGIFSGNGIDALIPFTPAAMPLVFPVESETENYKDANIRILYGSEDDSIAIKVEFPITPSNSTNLGDYAQVMNRERSITQIALFSFYGMFALYLFTEWRKGKTPRIEEDDEEEE